MPTTQPGLGFRGGILMWGEEITWGEAVARTKQIECESVSLSITDEPKVVSVIPKRSRFLDEVYQGITSVSGDISFPLRYEGAEVLLKHLLGSVITTNPGTLAYLHIFSLSDIVLEGLTLEKLLDANLVSAKTLLYTGARINSMDFSMEPDGALIASCNFIAKDEELNETPTSLTSSTSPLALFHQAIVIFNGGVISCRVASFNLTVNNSLAERYRACSRNTQQPLPSGKLEVSGSLTVEFESSAEWDLFVNQTTTDIRIKLSGAEIEALYNYELTFDLPFCKISGVPINPEDQGPIMVEMPFMAFATDSANREITIELQNSISVV